MKPLPTTSRPTEPLGPGTPVATTTVRDANLRRGGRHAALPDTVRVPLGEAVHPGVGASSAQVELRAREARARSAEPSDRSERRTGKRQKKLKLETVTDLGRLEAPAFGELVGLLEKHVGAVQQGLPIDEARLEQLGTQLRGTLKACRTTRADRKLSALRAAGMDRALLEVAAEGKLTFKAVRQEMTRVADAVKGQALSADQAKEALVTFDGLLQRLALAGEGLDYRARGNGPRDLLVTFAAAFHR